MAKENLVIEFGMDDACRDVYFPPLDRRMRGRFDAKIVAAHDADAGPLLGEWKEPLAGQMLAIEGDDVAVLEPLHKFPAIAARLKQRNLTLAPEREAVKCDPLTAMYYAREAVKAGQAKVISGTLPTDIDESKVQRDFIVKPPVNPQKSLASAIEAQTVAFNRLADALEKALTKR